MVYQSLLDFQASLLSAGIKTQIKDGIPDLYEYAIFFDGANQPGTFLLGKVKDNVLVLHHRTGMEGYDIKFEDNILTLGHNQKFIQSLKNVLLKFKRWNALIKEEDTEAT